MGEDRLPDGGRPLVEIVPNFSEGRRSDVIDAIVGSLQVPGARLLSWQADPDHNRLDCTLVGGPDAVRASALAGARTAVQLIDMDGHRGGHPRIGAVDVIPFVPVRGMTMDQCVDLARAFAKELADALSLPVYLYDRAATSPERESLARVRRGEYEGLRDDVARGERLPDYGPHQIGRAGAVAVGARKPLIAFNVYLSGDEAGAREIAEAIRESSGGLPAVRAIGFAVPERDLVQVSMNLVDHERTGLATAFEAVERRAARRGMEVIESEIVGLVPQAALDRVAGSSLRLGEAFDPDVQVLERLIGRLGSDAAPDGTDDRPSPIRAQTIGAFLEALAGAGATPGGGSAAAVAAAAGCALVAMVGRLTIGKKGYEDVSASMEDIVRDADAARARSLALADRDVEAFEAVMGAFRLPREGEDQQRDRAGAIQRALAAAAQVPLEAAEVAIDVLPAAVESIRRGNVNAASDGIAAAHLLAAGARSALANVEINAGSLHDASLARELRARVSDLEHRASAALDDAVASFASRIER